MRRLHCFAFLALVACASQKAEQKAEPAAVTNAPSAYPRDALIATFQSALKQKGWEAPFLDVDESEFPPILFGVIHGEHDGVRLREVVPLMSDPKYHHNGAVSRGDGKSRMAFALNVVPISEYPSGRVAEISSHMGERLKQLSERAFTKM